jgi:hypothetical protein
MDSASANMANMTFELLYLILTLGGMLVMVIGCTPLW